MLNKAELLKGFKQMVIPSDTILVHTSYNSLGGVKGGADAVIDVLLDLMGNNGTVVFPTFNFQSWSEQHYFDILETPSKMGIITELSRFRPGAKRSPHPMYSFVAIGKRADMFLRTDDVEAYGFNSAFALLHKLNATIVSIGLDFNNSFSMHHYIEYNVGCDYRHVKEFGGIYIGYDRVPRIKKYSMFVRNDDSVKTFIVPGMDELLDAGVIKEIMVGSARVHYVSANDFFVNMSVIIKQHPEMLHYIEKKKIR